MAILIVQDEKVSGSTAGGSAVAGKQQRDLNTVKVNTIVGASVSSNAITLPAGDYAVTAFAPAYKVNSHQISIYDETNSGVLAVGQSCAALSGNDSSESMATLIAVISLAVQTTMHLDHYTQSSRSSDGLGRACPSGDSNVFAVVKIEQL